MYVRKQGWALNYVRRFDHIFITDIRFALICVHVSLYLSNLTSSYSSLYRIVENDRILFVDLHNTDRFIAKIPIQKTKLLGYVILERRQRYTVNCCVHNLLLLLVLPLWISKTRHEIDTAILYMTYLHNNGRNLVASYVLTMKCDMGFDQADKNKKEEKYWFSMRCDKRNRFWAIYWIKLIKQFYDSLMFTNRYI